MSAATWAHASGFGIEVSLQVEQQFPASGE
jgi:hypothetical protein